MDLRVIVRIVDRNSPNDAFRQNGSQVTGGVTINCFGSGDTNYSCMKLADMTRLKKTNCTAVDYLRSNPDYVGDTVFSRLVSGLVNGHYDETVHLAARLVNVQPGEEFMKALARGSVTVAAANKNEQILLKIAARAIILNTFCSPLEPISMTTLHPYLCTLAPNSKIRIVSASHITDVPGCAKSFTLDCEQWRSDPPPVAIIPNNNKLCYAASSLTLLLTIPEVVSALYAMTPRCPDGARYINLLKGYAWFLSNIGFAADEIAALNVIMTSDHDPLTKYAHCNPDDSYSFILDLLKPLAEWSPAVFALFRSGVSSDQKLIQKMPELVCTDTVKPDVTLSASSRATIRGDLVEDESDGIWSVGYDENKLAFLPGDPAPPTKFVFAQRSSTKLSPVPELKGTVEEIIEKITPNPPPRVLLLSQALDVDEKASVFIVPCNITVHGHKYSLHGATMFDKCNTGGHYICMIVSNTSMYFYDSQFDLNSEDPREYRPRIICYVSV